MRIRNILISAWIITVIGSCGKPKNPESRNFLSFNSDIDSISESILRLNRIMDSSDLLDNFYYAIEEDYLHVKLGENESKRVIRVIETTSESHEALSFIEVSKRQDFINLTTYLSKNYVKRCDLENNQYIYVYKADIYMADRQKDLMRFVTYIEDKRDLKLDKYKVLDKKGKLYLLAYKDAEIW